MAEGTVSPMTMAHCHAHTRPQMMYGCLLPREDVPRFIVEKYRIPESAQFGTSLYTPPHSANALTLVVFCDGALPVAEHIVSDDVLESTNGANTSGEFVPSSWNSSLSALIEAGDPLNQAPLVPPPYFRF